MGVRRLTRAQGRVLFDRRARAELGISGATFLKRWRQGGYRVDRPDVVRVAMLLPFAR